jgi:hypothetical protein
MVPMSEERRKALGAAGVMSRMSETGVMGKFEISGPLAPMMNELKKFLGMKSGYSSGRISQKHVVGMLLVVSALMLLKRK